MIAWLQSGKTVSNLAILRGSKPFPYGVQQPTMYNWFPEPCVSSGLS
jgi:hypothetical protein